LTEQEKIPHNPSFTSYTQIKYDSSNRKYWKFFIISGILFFLVTFINLPYFILMPGTADPVKPMVSIPQNYPEEKGSIMLTTVRVTEANFIEYVIAILHPYQKIEPRSAILQKGESKEDYAERQEYMMESSQSQAIYVAYHYANIEVMKDIQVVSTKSGMPAHTYLKKGDIIQSIDQKTFNSYEDLRTYLKTKKIGDLVKLMILREGKSLTFSIPLAGLPGAFHPDGSQIAGLGMVAMDGIRLKPQDQNKKVSIISEDIGGPSAGLMFALEIYNQLIPQDITKGYQIAGTGTIALNGSVGEIGGIEFKIVAAHQAGAEIFFAPRLNYKLALDTAEQLKTSMKVIEINSFEEALRYLNSLPEKSR
jgi:PDZ domain-containing protein